MTRDARTVVRIAKMKRNGRCARIDQSLHKVDCILDRTVQQADFARYWKRCALRQSLNDLLHYTPSQLDTLQATSGVFRRADPMLPCTENCFGHPMLMSIAETSFSLGITPIKHVLHDFRSSDREFSGRNTQLKN